MNLRTGICLTNNIKCGSSFLVQGIGYNDARKMYDLIPPDTKEYFTRERNLKTMSDDDIVKYIYGVVKCRIFPIAREKSLVTDPVIFKLDGEWSSDKYVFGVMQPDTESSGKCVDEFCARDKFPFFILPVMIIKDLWLNFPLKMFFGFRQPDGTCLFV